MMDYSELVNTYAKLENTSKRLEKTYYLSQLLKMVDPKDLDKLLLLLQGRIYPSWDEHKIGVASSIVMKAIRSATGMSVSEIEEEWKNTGDLGLVAENSVDKKKQTTLFSAKLTLNKVFENLRSLALLKGSGTVARKVQLISELLTNAQPLEARYVIRSVLEDLRVGVGSGSLRDSIVWAYLPAVSGVFFRCGACKAYMPKVKKCLECDSDIDFKQSIKAANTLKVLSLKDVENKNLSNYELIVGSDKTISRQVYNYLLEAVQSAYDLTNDFSKVAWIVKTKSIYGLKKLRLEVGKPINVMLYKKVKDVKEAFETVGNPAALEYKYDGFRLQIHGKGKEITLFTRRLEKVTNQFPDLVKVIKESINANNFIIEGEVIGVDPKTKQWLPFQNISQRIRRKYGITEIAKEVPVMLNLFDALLIDDRSLVNIAFKDRRAALKKVVDEIPNKLNLAKELVTSDVKEADNFYKEALKKGNEGVMAKNMNAIYKPGSRVGYGVKIKPTMENVDVLVTGAEWGHGKRANWFTSFTVSVVDDMGDFLEIGKVGTGIKEKDDLGLSFDQLTKLLKPLITAEKGKTVRVKPGVILELSYEEIQKSPTYNSGFALRFPRVISLRADMSSEDCTNIELLRELYKIQKK